MNDFLFRGNLNHLDPDVYELTELEAERQVRKLILIPSESTTPLAIRQALGSAFHNIYAEGYPDESTRGLREDEILDYAERLAYERRYSDARYYKGVEYANIVEALARRRAAEAFATNGIAPEDLYVNVQPLSGAPANNAVYTALLQPGDTLMGLDLFHGGHLSHGSTANRSGKLYNAVHYAVDPATEKLDYDAIDALAQQAKPKIIVVGFSSYSWSVDWARFQEIAKRAGALLMADIAHVAGLVMAGEYPSPVGYADIITFTTHKTLCGPRGACIITTSASLAKKLDRAVFPGEQGGPHVNVFAGLAVAFKLAKTDQFKQLQRQIRINAHALAERLTERGLRIVSGGTDTHLLCLDLKTIKGQDGVTHLSGDQAARLLDLAGIVVNRNTIPGDKSALNPSGIRMASPWLTQRGYREADMVELADIIADLLLATSPYIQPGRKGELLRSKVDFLALEDARLRVRAMAERGGVDVIPSKHGYPHFAYSDDDTSNGAVWDALDLAGEHVRKFLNYALTSDVEDLKPGETQSTRVILPHREVDGFVTCLSAYEFRLSVLAGEAGIVAAWLRDLSDGFVAFDDDMLRKVPGPVLVFDATAGAEQPVPTERVAAHKPYFVGISEATGQALPSFNWQEPMDPPMRRTTLFDLHKQLGAKMVPFAGWEMPVWYSGVMEEHLATRQAAGLFDVSHMGVYQAEGPDACVFLDSLCGNDVSSLAVGESLYTHFLDPHANVIDDLLVYRRGEEKYLVVVNASNDDKNWTWLNAVREGRVMVDAGRPWARAFGRNVILRNLRDEAAGDEMRVDIALQGPKARDILLALGVDTATRKRIMRLERTQLCEETVGDFDLVVSRTGYTGERMAFELFVHPQRAAELFSALLKAGEKYGIKPCGLGARDSLRTEAGLPLYGHEMGGERNLGVAEAGFGSYVKVYKPWFIGRSAYLAREAGRSMEVVRFRFTEKGVRMAHNGDPVLDKRGKVIGVVTSCAVDKEGYLTGQAYLDLKYEEDGTPIYIYQGAPDKPGKAPSELKTGDKSLLPTPAMVVSRFMK